MSNIVFECEHMLIDPRFPDMVGCLAQVFGPFPMRVTCEKHCKGNPQAYQDAQRAKHAAKHTEPKKPAPCESYDAFTEQCTDPDCACSVTKAPCPMTIGGECRLYVPKPVPCAACGDKGAKA